MTKLVSACENIGILLIPEFSLMALSAVSEPLRAANLISGQMLYSWHLLSPEGSPVSSSSGLELLPEYSIGSAPLYDTVIVVASLRVQGQATRPLLTWLRRLAQHRVRIGAVSNASYLLARAGLLEQRRCTVHWEMLRDFQASFPTVFVERSLYVVDGDVITCAGGTAAIDLMLALIARRHGPDLAASIADNFVHTRIRAGDESQRMLVQWRYGISDSRLAKALVFMEQNLEQTLSPAAVAAMVGLSARQFERIFQKSFGLTPARFHLNLRLKFAQQLLRESTESIEQIAQRCGFSSVSHFSRAYREAFSATPARSRSRPTEPQQPAGHR